MLKQLHKMNLLKSPVSFLAWLQQKPFFLGGFIVVGLSSLFAFLSVLVMHYKTLGFDYKIENALSTGKITKLDSFFDFIADPLTISLIVVPIILFFLWRRTVWAVVFLTASSLGGWVLTEILKNLFKRLRPGVSPLEQLYSYPSGHTVVSICVFGALIYVSWVSLRSSFWKWLLTIVLLMLTFIIPFSRIYYNAHYPTDVIAGFLCGGAYLTTLITLHRLLNRPITNTSF